MSQLNFISRHYQEVLSSIKQIDVEETFDLYFSRFFGLLFARLGKTINLTPTHVSFLSLGFGVPGGILLYWQTDVWIIAVACFLITLAGILDSADGQLARMTGTSSEFGRMVDGTIDNMVFMACYFAGIAYFKDIYGLLTIVAIAGASGFAHSVKSAIYEFYKCEYQELMENKEESSIPYTSKEVEIQGNQWYHKVIYYIIVDYTNKQLRFITRSIAQRKSMRELTANSEITLRFLERYRDYNKSMLSWWAIFCGTNTHRTAIMVCSLFGRIDIYFIASVAWTIFIIPISLMQAKRDKELLQEFSFQNAA